MGLMNLTTSTLSLLLIVPMTGQRSTVLPDGFAVRCVSDAAELVCDDPFRLSIYTQFTASGVRSPGSPYFWRHFPRVMGAGWTMWLQQVRCAAMSPRGASLPHALLATLVGCSPESLRLALRWLDGAADAKTPFRIPGDEAYVRAVLRTYVPRIKPDPHFHGSGQAPYRYWVLPAEVIHQDHLSVFSEIERGARKGQRQFSFPELWGIGLDGSGDLSLDPNPNTHGGSTPTLMDLTPNTAGGSESMPQNPGGLTPNTHGGSTPTLMGVRPPHTPPCMHAALSMHADGPAELKSGETAPAKTGSSLDVATAVAAARHQPIELTGEVILRLDALPNGAIWRKRWQLWAHFTDVSNQIGFVIKATKQAAAGAEGYQAPPARLLALVAEEQGRERRAAGQPDLHTRVTKRETVRPETSVLPGLDALWTHVRHNAPLMSRAALEAATAVLLDGTTLVIEMPGTNAETLRAKHREKLLELAQAADSSISGLTIQHTKGGR